MIRVLLVEDDEIFRLGLTVSLKQASEVDLVDTSVDGQAAIDAAGMLNPDLILMDLGLPVMNGIEATRKIKKRYPQIKILALTSHTEPKLVNQIMDAGADGFCLKGISTERLVRTIEEVCQGTFWVDAAVAEQVRNRFNQPGSFMTRPKGDQPATEALDVLTEREREILGLLAEGLSNQEIADRLVISIGTVRVHVHAILHKLDVKDRTQAAIFLIQKQVEG